MRKKEKEIADKVVNTYKTIEKTVVEEYNKIEDKFVSKYLMHEGETLQSAKERLKKDIRKEE